MYRGLTEASRARLPTVSEPRTVTGVLTESVQAALTDNYGIAPGFAERLTGGEECLVARMGDVVIRQSPATRRIEDLRWAFGIATQLAVRVPEIVVPIPAAGGDLVVAIDGGSLSVWPYVAGTSVDRDDPAARTNAARLLAALHRAATALPVPPRTDKPSLGAPDDLDDRQLDAELSSWRSARMRRLV